MTVRLFHGIWLIQVALCFTLLQIASQSADKPTTPNPTDPTPNPINSSPTITAVVAITDDPYPVKKMKTRHPANRSIKRGRSEYGYQNNNNATVNPTTDSFRTRNRHGSVATDAAAVENIEIRKTSAIVPGDIMLGGLFPVHNKGVRTACGEIQADRGVQRLEAMLFAIDKINKDKSLLRDVKLGANIMDTCSRDTYALEQSLEYVRASLSSLDAGTYICADGSRAVPANSPVPVVGVIGGSYSTVSIQVANLFRLFRIPQISYASTSAALSDKSRFDYFARTVPPDNFQAKAIADIVRSFNWTYVSTVASEGNYGEMGIESFKQEATVRNICIAVHRKVIQSATPDDFDDVIESLLEQSMARVVVLFLRVEDASNLLLAARRRNDTDHFVWIASDGWGSQDMPVRNKEYVAEGALTIELQSTALVPFDRYFMSLNPDNNKRNPWFVEYWQSTFACRLRTDDPDEANATYCSGAERISPVVYKQETKIQFVYDAVYALAYALDNMFMDHCGKYKGRKNRKRCIQSMRIDGRSLFYDYLLNVSFNGKDRSINISMQF